MTPQDAFEEVNAFIDDLIFEMGVEDNKANRISTLYALKRLFVDILANEHSELVVIKELEDAVDFLVKYPERTSRWKESSKST